MPSTCHSWRILPKNNGRILLFDSLTRKHPLAAVLGRSRGALIAVAIFSAGINLLVLTGTIYMMQVFDRVLTGQSRSTLFFLTLLALFMLSIYGVLELVRSRILVRIGTWLDAFLSPLVLARGLESCVSGQQSSHSGLRDLNNLRNFVSGPGLLALLDAPWVPIYLVMTFFLHPLIGVVTTLSVIILFTTAALSNYVNARNLHAANALGARNNMLLHAAFRHAPMADGMGMLSAVVRRWYLGNAEILAAQQEASDRMGLVTAATKFFRSSLQIVILAVGAWLVLNHELTAGGMTAASIIMSRALAPVESAVASWKQIGAAAAAWVSIGRLLQQGKLHAGTMRLPRPAGKLQIDGVSHVVEGSSTPVLFNIHLEVQPGEVLAIIGPSGAGKSTLAKLIVGLSQPTRGCVRLDGADMFTWDRTDLGPQVGYLPQEAGLLPGTIGDNIARLQEDPDASQVVKAATVAGVHDLILRMPGGYDTELIDGGANLSGGQKQRIGLARAVFGNPALVVLDEPNSNLDSVGDHALNETIRTLKQLGTTVVIVAHRPSLMRHVDQIAVLDEGRLQMFGPKTAILAKLQAPVDLQTAKAS